MTNDSEQKVAFYPGPDRSPTQMLGNMEADARQLDSDFEVLMLPGHGEEGHENIVSRADDVRNCAAIVIGFNNDLAHGEHCQHQIALVRELLKHKVHPRIIFMEDIPENGMEYLNIRDSGIAGQATLLTAASGYEDRARTFGWQNVEHVCLPPHHQQTIRNIRQGVEIAKNDGIRVRPYGTDGEGEPLGDRKVVGVWGYSRPETEARVLESVRTRFDADFGPEGYAIGYAWDSREPGRLEAHPAHRDEWVPRRRAALEGTLAIANPELQKIDQLTGAVGSQYVDGCNIAHPGSSLIHTVGFQRLKVASCMSYPKELAPPDQNYPFERYAQWNTIVFDNPDQAAEVIKYLLSAQGQQALRETQEEHYPNPIPNDWNGAQQVNAWLRDNV